MPASWVSPRRFPGDVLTRGEGGWRLTAVDADPASDDAGFAGRRQEHLYCRARAVVAAHGDGVGGLSVRMDPRHRLELQAAGDVVRAVAQVGPLRSLLGEAAVPAGDVVLEVRAVPSEGHFSSTALSPDQLVAGVVDADGGFTELGRIDGRYLSTEVAGGMTGRMLGVWCSSGSVVVRSFHYAGSDEPGELP
nr:hypothetical protein [Modestobacter marinus]